MRHCSDMPDVSEEAPGLRLQNAGKFPVVIPRTRDGTFINGALCDAELRAFLRDVSLRSVQSHVALALLLGIVEGMCVQERPDKLPANILQAEFEMRVLIDRVVAAVKRRRANIDALFLCDLLGNDQTRRITCARRGDCRIVRMRECISECDTRGCCFYWIRWQS